MTEIDNPSKVEITPAKEEFFDAVRRHICQILGFDFGFIDLVSGHEIVNVASFSSEEANAEVLVIVDSLEDEHKQSLTIPNTHLAQKVRQTQKPWLGRVFSNDSAKDETGQQIGYPYALIPILTGSDMEGSPIRGLIRVLSFDANREINDQDLATLKLMGEHLSDRLGQFHRIADVVPEQASKATSPSEQHILIIHSNRPIRRRFSRMLANHYQILEADNGDKALEVLRHSSVDLILLDSEVQGTSGLAFCKVLKEAPQWKQIPIILVTQESNPASRIEGLNVGADDCLSETCLDPELLARVRSSLRHRKAERELAIQLELLEDYSKRLEQATEKLSKEKQIQLKQSRDANNARQVTEILRNQEALLHRISNTIRRSFNIEENLTVMLEELSGYLNLDCSFVVLPTPNEPEDSVRCQYASEEDYKVQDFDIDLKVLQLFQKYYKTDEALIVNDVARDRRLEAFKEEITTRHPVLSLFIVPISYEERLLGILAGFRCESEAVWTQDNETFFNSVADQVAIGVINARLYAKVQRQATTDGLTGLLNHRTGQEKLTEQLRLAERYQRNLAVIMFDVDHFKSINDKHGHPAGDSVLKAVSRLIQRDCRDVDLPVRYGGEEFLLILPEINSEGAAVVAERIRKNLLQEIVHHEDIQITVTASMGIAAFPEDAQSQTQLLDLADKALYLSKHSGRNQVHTASDLLYQEIAPASPVPASNKAWESAELPPQFVAPDVPASAKEREELVPEVVEMVKALATALYSKSEYNKVHHLETARMAELLGKVMGLSQQEVEQIRVAGLLHDVGTLSIPADLLDKQADLSEEERQIIRQHPVSGAELLRPIRALKDICEILEHHHERWDGSGYPRGLQGEAIPLAARIVSIVDSYHAMISDRPYRKAMTDEEAIATLKAGAGHQWDPFLVDIFLAVLASLKQNATPA